MLISIYFINIKFIHLKIEDKIITYYKVENRISLSFKINSDFFDNNRNIVARIINMTY